jgi:hypothetical protein
VPPGAQYLNGRSLCPASSWTGLRQLIAIEHYPKATGKRELSSSLAAGRLSLVYETSTGISI